MQRGLNRLRLHLPNSPTRRIAPPQLLSSSSPAPIFPPHQILDLLSSPTTVVSTSTPWPASHGLKTVDFWLTVAFNLPEQSTCPELPPVTIFPSTHPSTVSPRSSRMLSRYSQHVHTRPIFPGGKPGTHPSYPAPPAWSNQHHRRGRLRFKG